MTHTFQSPRSYHPSYSLLGRAFRTWTKDRLRAEAFFIVALTGLALLLLMGHYLGWALLKPTLTSNPSWQLLFWAGQLASVAAWIAIGLLGMRPGVTVACTPDALEVTQGSRSCTVHYDNIEDVDTISAKTYHRHYRRYAATQVFVSQLPDEVLLLQTPEGPLVLALPNSDDQNDLRTHIETARTTAPEPVAQPHS